MNGDDGSAALLVDSGGIDGGAGTFFASHGDDVHAVGTLDPIVPGHVGRIVVGRTGVGCWLASHPIR